MSSARQIYLATCSMKAGTGLCWEDENPVTTGKRWCRAQSSPALQGPVWSRLPGEARSRKGMFAKFRGREYSEDQGPEPDRNIVYQLAEPVHLAQVSVAWHTYPNTQNVSGSEYARING